MAFSQALTQACNGMQAVLRRACPHWHSRKLSMVVAVLNGEGGDAAGDGGCGDGGGDGGSDAGD